MVRRVPSACRSASGPSAARSRPVHRRLGFGLGRVSSGRPSVRLVVSRVFSVFNQPPGTSCGALRSSGVPSCSSESICLPLRGQHDSSVLSEASVGDPLLHAELCGSGHSSLLRGQSDSSGASVCSRPSECPRGLPQSPLPGLRLRVDRLSPNVPGASPSVAGQHRPVRDLVLGSSPSVLLSSCGSAVSGYGRHDAALVWSAGVCLPSLRPAASCAVEGSAIQGSGAHPCGSVLASMPLVSGPFGASGGCPSVPSLAEGSTQTAPLPSLLPEPPRASSDCISYLERSARSFGFSSAVARQLARCRRAFSRVNYQAKSVYRAGCRRDGHSVSHPSVPKIASFLLYLRRSLSLSFSSIASYRSMLSGVFRFVLPELSSDFVLRDLLRSFRLEHPVSSRILPWDLSCVLSFLRGPPFEPLAFLVSSLGRSSFCWLWRRFAGSASSTRCLRWSPFLVVTSTCPFFLSFGLSRSLRLVLFLVPFEFILFPILLVTFLMNFFVCCGLLGCISTILSLSSFSSSYPLYVSSRSFSLPF